MTKVTDFCAFALSVSILTVHYFIWLNAHIVATSLRLLSTKVFKF